MPRPRRRKRKGQSGDLFAQVRLQAEKALALLNAEIHRTEGDLKRLLSQAALWREAVTGVRATATQRLASIGRRGRKAAAAALRSVGAGPGRPRRAGGKRVDWDAVLRSVPEKFRVDDILKHPGARAKGRAQIYPALTRWQQAKKIKKIGKGHYQRV